MINPAPIQQPIASQGGLVTQVWVQWLNLLRLQVNVAPTFNVADLPTNYPAGSIAYVPNAAGSVTLAFYDGTNWLRSDTGAIVT
jgi:hypothetical protein